jgi:hypothetical protein
MIICLFYNLSSECKRCIAHLEASVTVLLNCLETVLENKSIVNEGCFSWEVEEGVKCACFLRRIYEEVCTSMYMSSEQ